MSLRALLIINTKSRRGGEARAEIESGLRARGIAPEHREAEDRDALTALIVEASADKDLIVVAGGDGTLNAAGKGLIEARKPLGIVPTGTANDLARTLGLPTGLDDALDVIAAGSTRPIDLGAVNGIPFFNVASIGMSVELAERLTGDLKKRFGRLGYAVAAFGALTRARPFRATIKKDGETRRVHTLQVAVGNGRFYGGGNQVDENAEIDDGLLDLYSLEAKQAWKTVLMFKALRYGQHGSWEELRTMSGAAFEVSTRSPRSVNADGEIVTKTPARFEILPLALDVIAPRPEPA